VNIIEGDNPSIIKVGTTPLYSFVFEIESDGNFVPLDLTAATIEFIGNLKSDNSFKWNAAGSILVAANGTFTAQLDATDTDTAGTYIAEIKITKGADIYKSDDFIIKILPARVTS